MKEFNFVLTIVMVLQVPTEKKINLDSTQTSFLALEIDVISLRHFKLSMPVQQTLAHFLLNSRSIIQCCQGARKPQQLHKFTYTACYILINLDARKKKNTNACSTLHHHCSSHDTQIIMNTYARIAKSTCMVLWGRRRKKDASIESW